MLLKIKITLENQITLKGLDDLVIRVSELTKIFGDANGLDDIRSGQNVKVLGYADTEGKVEATQVKVKDNDKGKLKLQGPVTDINQFTLTILKVEVDTSSIPEDGFETDTQGAVSRNEFLDLVACGGYSQCQREPGWRHGYVERNRIGKRIMFLQKSNLTAGSRPY